MQHMCLHLTQLEEVDTDESLHPLASLCEYEASTVLSQDDNSSLSTISRHLGRLHPQVVQN